MPYKSDIAKTATCFKPKKVLLLGSAGLSIGKTDEFDSSWSQVNIYLYLNKWDKLFATYKKRLWVIARRPTIIKKSKRRYEFFLQIVN